MRCDFVLFLGSQLLGYLSFWVITLTFGTKTWIGSPSVCVSPLGPQMPWDPTPHSQSTCNTHLPARQSFSPPSTSKNYVNFALGQCKRLPEYTEVTIECLEPLWHSWSWVCAQSSSFMTTDGPLHLTSSPHPWRCNPAVSLGPARPLCLLLSSLRSCL